MIEKNSKIKGTAGKIVRNEKMEGNTVNFENNGKKNRKN